VVAYDVRLVGFTTYTGTVAAADDWDQPPQIKSVRPALPDRPQTERNSHHFYARRPDQFDAVIHFDVTTAIESLIPVAEPSRMAPAPSRAG
jgi:erythromycin esterase-like protein